MCRSTAKQLVCPKGGKIIMTKKKILSTILISALTVTVLAACGEVKKTAKENVEISTENRTEGTEVLETEQETEVSREVTEYTDSYCFTEVDDTRETVDEVELREETPAKLKDTIDFYNSNGFYLGYTKPNIEVNILGKTDNWVCFELADTSIVFSKASEFYAVSEVVENSENTESVENSEISEPEVVESETTDNSAKENTNTNKETQKNTEPAYTVKDMSATKYAKQSVNVRKGPGTSYGKVGSLSTNQKVTVTGQADNGWYRIDYNGTEAFVSNNYLVDKKVETTNNDTGNKKDTSSNNSSKNNSTSNNSTNESENNSGNTNKNTENNNSSNTGGTTSKTYTEAEVISIFRNTLESNGIRWYPDTCTQEELDMWGMSGGMGYGSAKVPMDDPYSDAMETVESFKFSGYNLYYLDGVSSSNGMVYFTLYRGTM